MIPRPYALLAELTHQCPLHCPYCSNPEQVNGTPLLSAGEWSAVFAQAAELGVVQAGLSGGEPLLRRDLEEIVKSARQAGLYTNLITSGVGLSSARARALAEAGLDSVQLSFQSDSADLADRIAGTNVHLHKLDAARAIIDVGFPLTTNVVLHRHNIERLPQIVAFIASLGARRVELANTQYYGWAWKNRPHLLPTPEQVRQAESNVTALRAEWAERMEIIYVPPDYYGSRPKPCLFGWGQSHLTVAPGGEVLPCPTAWSIPGMIFENVRSRGLREIWSRSQAFNEFRGTAWMPEPCRSCPEKKRDFGGCRCQAALMLGAADTTDPVCSKSPRRATVDEAIRVAEWQPAALEHCAPRQNPSSKELPISTKKDLGIYPDFMQPV